ncbi:hypothetical protein DPX16_1095 [Anabarilius grahami]|uniref:Uncharacterized protein n=1 Tax=Anabarilius grahami TaxID=495550 RepID=A0A3N0YCY0_ANAGA|nr:hypothetical protein DPX16_1095 [Anabarilius grahami]
MRRLEWRCMGIKRMWLTGRGRRRKTIPGADVQDSASPAERASLMRNQCVQTDSLSRRAAESMSLLQSRNEGSACHSVPETVWIVSNPALMSVVSETEG